MNRRSSHSLGSEMGLTQLMSLIYRATVFSGGKVPGGSRVCVCSLSVQPGMFFSAYLALWEVLKLAFPYIKDFPKLSFGLLHVLASLHMFSFLSCYSLWTRFFTSALSLVIKVLHILELLIASSAQSLLLQ